MDAFALDGQHAEGELIRQWLGVLRAAQRHIGQSCPRICCQSG
jgi:hypothetical protein